MHHLLFVAQNFFGSPSRFAIEDCRPQLVYLDLLLDDLVIKTALLRTDDEDTPIVVVGPRVALHRHQDVEAVKFASDAHIRLPAVLFQRRQGNFGLA